MSEFKTKIFEEPKLEFGDELFHQDPRHGLTVGGPLQPSLGEKIRLGVVGSTKTIEATEEFVELAAKGVLSSKDSHPNMNPDFPGFNNNNPFRCTFEIDQDATSAMPSGVIEKIIKEPNHAKAVQLAVDEICKQLEEIEQRQSKPDAVIIALPVKLIDRVWSAKIDSKGTTEKEDSSGLDTPNFRGLLKAKAMNISFPIQIIWEDVLDPKVSVSRKVKESRSRKTQDASSVMWNLFSTLYYKGSGKIPWRKSCEIGELKACYVGISFYREANGQQLFTSSAQMFDERGRGFVLKGGRANTESRGKHPYMNKEDASSLISKVLDAYKSHHKHYPARVIVLKTSRFRDEEANGIIEALEKSEVELRDLVWVQESYSMKVLRDGNYPVMRGTFVDLGGNGLLYTNGSIPYYGTYPGMYDPKPILICPHIKSESTVRKIAEEIFALTKINWNSTQINQRLPIPIKAARSVGEVLKYIPEGQFVSSDYRKYI